MVKLSIIIPALNEEKNIIELIPAIHKVVSQILSDYEIILIDGGSADNTRNIATRFGIKTIVQTEKGYGGALREGFRTAQGEYILTLDADLSHSPDFISQMWAARDGAEIVVASRYIPGSSAETALFRKVLSVILNKIFTLGLSLPLKDISSGFRLYHSCTIRNLTLDSSDFDILEEVLIKCYAQGWSIKEIPFQYLPRKYGNSQVKLFQFGISYLRTFNRMWRLRNSALSADYDNRAFFSRIPLQRYWHRRRYQIITKLAQEAQSCLDIGCGSSRILSGLDNGIGVDIQLPKLRYSRKYGKPLANASIHALPFRDDSFDCVVCSQLIEHLPAGEEPFLEISRVLKSGGRLIIGTPDYAKLSWRIIEWLYKLLIPWGYADEHITHYSRNSLVGLLEEHGFAFQKAHYVLGSEMILQFVKL